jgi:hypothetical protein
MGAQHNGIVLVGGHPSSIPAVGLRRPDHALTIPES